jgi:hypothetical protein
MRRLALLTVVAAACAAVPGADAQTVRGIVVDLTQTPVPGVVVQLMSANQGLAARALTNERGEFRLAAPAPGSYRLRTMRIGFRPTLSEVVVIAAGAEVVHTLTLAGVPFSLDTVRVVSRTSCRVPSDSAAATFAVWEQARTALTAATLTRRAQTVNARIVTFERTLDAGDGRVTREEATARAGYTSRAWRALAADSLRKVGYVVADRSGEMTFYAPDIDVLLSDGFAEDHCFRLVDDRGRSQVGIAFEPIRSRTKSDIRGTIWLDRKTTELRTVDFLYTSIHRAMMDANAGGGIAFARLATGAWVITRWDIRMPVIERRLGSMGVGGRMAASDETRVREIQVAGGQLAAIIRGADTLWTHPPLAITGIVTDSASGRALADVALSVPGTGVTVRSDAAGRFALRGLVPGSYAVMATLASSAAVETHVTLVDASVDLKIRVPALPPRVRP